jgi:hypothetical protein
MTSSDPNTGKAPSHKDVADFIASACGALSEETGETDDGQVYAWRNSAAGDAVKCLIPNGSSSYLIAVTSMSFRMRRALRRQDLDPATETDLALTLNTPEKVPAANISAGKQQLGVLAVDGFLTMLKDAGFANRASIFQRIGRSLLWLAEKAITPLLYPYDEKRDY